MVLKRKQASNNRCENKLVLAVGIWLEEMVTTTTTMQHRFECALILPTQKEGVTNNLVGANPQAYTDHKVHPLYVLVERIRRKAAMGLSFGALRHYSSTHTNTENIMLQSQSFFWTEQY